MLFLSMIRCEPVLAYLPELLREEFLSSPAVSALKLQNSAALSQTQTAV